MFLLACFQKNAVSSTQVKLLGELFKTKFKKKKKKDKTASS